MRTLVHSGLLLGCLTLAVGCSKPSLGTHEERSYLSTSDLVGLSTNASLPKTSPHKSTSDGFTIHLPAGWAPIPAELLKRQSEALSGPNVKIEYVAGFQLEANEPFAHPLILVRRVPASTMPKESLAQMRRIFRDQQAKIKETLEKESGVKGVVQSMGVPSLDPESGAVYMKAAMNSLDGQPVEGLIANWYVGDSILQFNAGVLASRSREDWLIIERALRTVDFK